MSITIGTSPVIAHGASVSSTATCAAFNPPDDTILVVCIAANTSTSGVTTTTVTNNGVALTWTKQIEANFSNAGNGYSAIYTAPLTTGRTGLTITVTTAGSTATTRRPSFKVYTVVGGRESNIVASFARGTSVTNAITPTFTQASANSMLFVAASEWNKRGVPTSSNLTAELFDQAGADGVSGVFGYRLLDATVGSESYNLDAFGTSAAAWNYVYIEVNPALAAEAFAGADVANQTVNTPLNRVATELDNGSTITARSWTIVSGPTGAGSTLSTTATLAWTPTVNGVYVLRYSVTNVGGTGTDDVTVTVQAAPPTGVPVLEHSLANTKTAVQVAWGADLTADDTTWVWTDITDDVRIKDGIDIKIGRGDEAGKAQPATCTMKLDNSTFAYSLGGISPNYPYVRRNTPVRVSMYVDGAWTSIFNGYADGFTPDWNLKGNVATVTLSASGILRRLQQGESPIISPLTRYYSSNTNVIGYWPLEEGANATVFTSGIGGPDGDPSVYDNYPKFASYDRFVGSKPIPIMNNSTWRFKVPNTPSTGAFTVQWLMGYGTTDEPDMARIWYMTTTGSVNFWEMRYAITDGDFTITAFAGSTQVMTASLDANLLDEPVQFTLKVAQNGANIDWFISWLPQFSTTGTYFPGTIAGQTVGSPVEFNANPEGLMQNIAFGQLAVFNTSVGTFDGQQFYNAYQNDLSIDSTNFSRLGRVAEENDVPITLLTSTTFLFVADCDFMGIQPTANMLTIMDEAATVNDGLIFDGMDFGLTYASRKVFMFPDQNLVLDAAAGDLAEGFSPTHDDQGIVNRSTITRKHGTTITYEDTNGPVGVNTVGLYDDSETINFQYDSVVEDRAAWEVFQGTYDGYRFPEVTIDFGASPELLSEVIVSPVSSRITISNLSDVLTGMNDQDVKLTIEGYAWHITPFEITWTANCSPYSRWLTGELEASPGVESEFDIHLDTDGSTLTSSVAKNATSISVTTTSGPIWTTSAGDFPMDLNVGGIKVRATAASGTSSPQTFTVSALPQAIAAGSSVKVWEVPALLL